VGIRNTEKKKREEKREIETEQNARQMHATPFIILCNAGDHADAHAGTENVVSTVVKTPPVKTPRPLIEYAAFTASS
jgi:hypothetical protein